MNQTIIIVSNENSMNIDCINDNIHGQKSQIYEFSDQI